MTKRRILLETACAPLVALVVACTIFVVMCWGQLVWLREEWRDA